MFFSEENWNWMLRKHKKKKEEKNQNRKLKSVAMIPFIYKYIVILYITAKKTMIVHESFKLHEEPKIDPVIRKKWRTRHICWNNVCLWKKKMHIKKCNIRVMTSNRMVCICVCVWLLVEFKRSIKKKFQWIRIENENRKQKLFFFLLYFCDLKLQIEKFFFFRLSLAHQTLQFIEKYFFFYYKLKALVG